MTVYNGDGKDVDGNINPNLSDVVPWYTRFDVGVGYTRPDGLMRLDAFVNNLTDVVYMTSLINTPDLNLRFFGPPRQYAARLTLFL
jgi:outer membrane receptor protein involved in Fe transport